MFVKEIYISRRERLMEKMGKGLILLLGNSEASTNYPSNTYKFRQDSTFLYFFGLNEPDLAAIIDPETGDQVLFGNNVAYVEMIIQDICYFQHIPIMSIFACGINVN